jgi:uncharacterized membrane protein YbhN (UPF0104 family)
MALKAAIALLLLIGLYRLGSIDYSGLSAAFADRYLLGLSLSFLFIGIVLSGVRWWILLRITGHSFPLRKCLKIQLLGSFFSTYLPGAAGGDLIRGAYVLALVDKGKGRTSAVVSIVADRLFALLGLIFVGACAAAYIFQSDAHSEGLQTFMRLILLLVILSPLSVAVGIATVLVAPRTPIFAKLPDRLQTYLWIATDVATKFGTHWPAVLACAAMSILASSIVAAGIVAIAACFLYFPGAVIVAIAGVFGNVFSAVPITPGGLGVGESVFASICRELSGVTAPFATIYLAFRIQMFIVNIPGGVIAVVDRITRRK